MAEAGEQEQYVMRVTAEQLGVQQGCVPPVLQRSLLLLLHCTEVHCMPAACISEPSGAGLQPH